jgi:hypothetical protein
VALCSGIYCKNTARDSVRIFIELYGRYTMGANESKPSSGKKMRTISNQHLSSLKAYKEARQAYRPYLLAPKNPNLKREKNEAHNRLRIIEMSNALHDNKNEVDRLEKNIKYLEKEYKRLLNKANANNANKTKRNAIKIARRDLDDMKDKLKKLEKEGIKLKIDLDAAESKRKSEEDESMTARLLGTNQNYEEGEVRKINNNDESNGKFYIPPRPSRSLPVNRSPLPIPAGSDRELEDLLDEDYHAKSVPDLVIYHKKLNGEFVKVSKILDSYKNNNSREESPHMTIFFRIFDKMGKVEQQLISKGEIDLLDKENTSSSKSDSKSKKAQGGMGGGSRRTYRRHRKGRHTRRSY